MQKHLHGEFPHLISSGWFIQRLPSLLQPLGVFLHTQLGACTGIAFIDSTALAVCDNRRIHSHRVFDGLAARNKTSMGWFFGFKLHLLGNDRGELLAVRLMPGNVDDRKPVPALVKQLFGKPFGDKGYFSQSLRDQLHVRGVELSTKLKSNMKNRLMPLGDKLLLRKRAVIEASSTSSRTSRRLSSLAIAASSTSSFTWSPGWSLIAFSPRNRLWAWRSPLSWLPLIHTITHVKSSCATLGEDH